MIKYWLRRLWRRIRRRCLLCGAARSRHTGCVHCMRAGDARLCHRCAKSLVWARVYGMGAKKLSEMFI
jgi:hypothetical protein